MARSMSNIPTTMAHSGNAPWHGNSTEIPAGATAKRIQKMAGMDFTVNVANAEYRDSQGRRHTTEKTRILYREDTGAWLDDVGPDYVPLQNDVAFRFIKKFVDAGDMRIETAGVFGGGQKAWLLASTGDAFTVGGKRSKDRVDSKLLFYVPHQYGQSVQILWTGVCVVCLNTLGKALGGAEERVRILHMVDYSDAIENEAQEKLGLADDRMKAFKVEAEKLAQIEMPAEAAREIVFEIFAARNAEKVVRLFNGEAMGADIPSRQNTAWGLLNAATEFIDHHSGQRTDDQGARLHRAWFGKGQTEKNKMREAVLSYAGSI